MEDKPIAWTEVGNPTKKITSALTVTMAGGAGVSLTDYAGGSYAIANAVLGLGALELHLQAPERCDEWWEDLRGPVRCKDSDDGQRISGVVELLGPTDIDLVAGPSTSPLTDVRIPAAAYTHAVLKLAAHSMSPAKLGLWARAVGADDARLQAVEPGLPEGSVLTTAPASVDVAGDGTLELRIDPSHWLAGVDLDACTAAGDPPVHDGVMSLSQEAEVAPCGACDGGITELALRWEGSTGATVRMRDGGVELFEAVLRTNEEFRIQGNTRTGVLPNIVIIEIDGEDGGRLRASCGRSEGIGERVGDLVVVGGRSLFGDRLCAPDGLDPSDPSDPSATVADGCAGVTAKVLDAIRSSAVLGSSEPPDATDSVD